MIPHGPLRGKRPDWGRLRRVTGRFLLWVMFGGDFLVILLLVHYSFIICSLFVLLRALCEWWCGVFFSLSFTWADWCVITTGGFLMWSGCLEWSCYIFMLSLDAIPFFFCGVRKTSRRKIQEKNRKMYKKIGIYMEKTSKQRRLVYFSSAKTSSLLFFSFFSYAFLWLEGLHFSERRFGILLSHLHQACV